MNPDTFRRESLYTAGTNYYLHTYAHEIRKIFALYARTHAGITLVVGLDDWLQLFREAGLFDDIEREKDGLRASTLEAIGTNADGHFAKRVIIYAFATSQAHLIFLFETIVRTHSRRIN